ncbi:MAG: serine/threonine-protein phosphatase [Anaerolineales bacterium]|nr:serine/threonine-protein phosphatase [Anaerolineales bacterium]
MLTELRIEIAAATSVGRLRRTNADAHLVDERAGLLAVADGMGDTPRSAAVAKMALEAVGESFGEPWRSLPPEERSISEAKERLLLGVVEANARLFVPGAKLSSRGGTTLVAVALSTRHFCVTSVGDSRAYLLRRSSDRLAQLTVDDTVLQEDLQAGTPYEVAIAQRDAHALTRAIGVRPAVHALPFIHRSAPGDVLLLCSDGLSDRVRVEELGALLAEAEDLERAAHHLIERAKAGRSGDDVTVVIARRDGAALITGDETEPPWRSGIRRITPGAEVQP